MFQQLLTKLAIELSKRDIPYMIIGDQAVLIYGEPRLTKDIDITLGVGPEEIEKVKSIIKKLGLKVLVPKVDDFVNKTMVCPVIDKKSGIRIDFIFSFTPYEKQAIARAKKVKLGHHYIKFTSLEDLIIHKLIARRQRDIEDIKTIILKNPDFNRSYIIKWLKDFDEALSSNIVEVYKKIIKEI